MKDPAGEKHPGPEGAQQGTEDVEQEIQDLTESLDRAPAEPVRTTRKAPVSKWWTTWPVAAVLLAVAGGMTLANVMGAGPFRRGVEPLSPMEQRELLQGELDYVVEFINAEAAATGRLPENLLALGIHPEDGFDYRRIDATTFWVAATDGDIRVEYTSPRDTESGVPVPAATP